MNNIISFSFYRIRKEKEVFQQMLNNIMTDVEEKFLKVKCDKITIAGVYDLIKFYNTEFYNTYGVEDILRINKNALETKSEIEISIRKDLLDFLMKE